MIEDFDRNPYAKKAFELAYAMLRIARSLKSETISRRLEDYSDKLLGFFATGQYREGTVFIEELAWFIRLWTEMEFIHRHLGESLLLELSKLRNTALEVSDAKVLPNSVQDLFPAEISATTTYKRKDKLAESAFPKSEEKIAVSGEKVKSFHYQSSNRQSAIIDFIKQKSVSGNDSNSCRMKDIQDNFPFVSERTLRYDLQKMVEQRQIERVGGGPVSAYRFLGEVPQEAVTITPDARYIN